MNMHNCYCKLSNIVYASVMMLIKHITVTTAQHFQARASAPSCTCLRTPMITSTFYRTIDVVC